MTLASVEARRGETALPPVSPRAGGEMGPRARLQPAHDTFTSAPLAVRVASNHGVALPSDVLPPPDDSLIGRVSRVLERPRADPMSEHKHRLAYTYSGLDRLVSIYAPSELQQYASLLRRVENLAQPAQVPLVEAPLRALRARVMDAARAEAPTELAARLAFLQQRGLVSRAWRIEDGRVVRERAVEDDDNVAGNSRYSRFIPVEAELVLDSRLTVGAVDRNTQHMTFVRGEDYGSDRLLRNAEQTFATRQAELATVTERERELDATIAQANERAEAAQTRIEQARATVEAAITRGVRERADAGRLRQVADEADRAVRAAEAERETGAARMTAELLRLEQGIDLAILFETGSSTLRPESRRQLQTLAATLGDGSLRGLPISVVGHTDAKGTPQRNQALSEQRAAAVVDYLASLGVPRANLTPRGMGQVELKDPANPFADANRRVQITVDISPERRAELRASATAAQSRLDARVVELAQTAYTANEQAAAAAAIFANTAKTSSEARAEFEVAQAEYVAAMTRRRDAERERPGVGAAVTRLRDQVSAAQRAIDDARPSAEGSLLIEYFRGSNIVYDNSEAHHAQRIALGLERSFAPHGAEGAFARRIASLTHQVTGRRLSLDIGQALAQYEAAKGGFTVFGEQLGDILNVTRQWIHVRGYRGTGQYLTGMDRVPDDVPPVVVAVEMVSAAELDQRLRPRAERLSVVAGPAEPGSVTDVDSVVPPLGEPLPVDPFSSELAATADTIDAMRVASQARLDEAQRALARRRAEDEALRAAAARQPASLPGSGGAPRIELGIAFDLDSALITDDSALRRIGSQLQAPEYQGLRIVIAGHTDDRGSEAHNMDLSRRRAMAVRDYLVRNFGLRNEIVVQGYGATRLKNRLEPMAAENRRVELSVGGL